MTKLKTTYTCQLCGASYGKWAGRCENCGAWNSLVESAATPAGKTAVSRSQGKLLEAKRLDAVKIDSVKDRQSTGIADIDIVLGGGIMAGGVMLVAGEPGIGKSTLLLQIAAHVADTQPVLYVTGEESAGQVKLRANRLGASAAGQLSLISTTSADDIAVTIASGSYHLVIVDSVQTLVMADIASAPGTVSQITNATNLIIQSAKRSNTAVMLVGHVTKEGSIAGPKVMEHLVDVVLQFEGDRYGGFKMVRAVKNRYGSTAELAIFEMNDRGLVPVDNPSASLLAERSQVDGSIILATMEGNRSLLVEIQALVNPTSFGYPKRTASGFDLNRLNLLVAVLEKRTKLQLSDKDIFVNVVGGLKLRDPAADLAVCMAIASAAAGRAMDQHAVVYGEVGLGGEIRSSAGSAKRIAEARKLGFTYAVAPAIKPADAFIKPAHDVRTVLTSYLTRKTKETS
ncbi:DNA repair protein RadA [Candidatus Saccharibacteria bacterium]|nr:DNA repair protein RadA [Candidatus Saccharibacteria bacterium]